MGENIDELLKAAIISIDELGTILNEWGWGSLIIHQADNKLIDNGVKSQTEE